MRTRDELEAVEMPELQPSPGISECRVELESRAGAVWSCNPRYTTSRGVTTLLQRGGSAQSQRIDTSQPIWPHSHCPASRRLVAAVDQPAVACLVGAWHAPNEGSRGA